jgi:hypothetical protein
MRLRPRSVLPPLLLAVALLAIAWFVRPWVQPLAYRLFVESPGVLQWLAVVTLVLLGYAAYGSRVGWLGADVRVGTSAGRLPLPLIAAGVLVVLAVVTGSVVGGLYEAEATSERVGERVSGLQSLPETDDERSRLLPQSVAREYAQNSLQYPRYRLAGGDISVVDGTPHWSFALAPDGAVNSVRLQQRGGVFVDMTTTDKRVSVREQSFAVGQGMAITDDYRWQLSKHAYWRDYRDPFVVPHGDDLYLAVPYVTHDWEFRATPLPQAHSVPEFGGVSLVAANGSITDLTPAEARDSDALAGQNVYPYELARHEVASRAYQNGIVNTWFTHEDQLELAPVPGANDQPFTVFWEAGPTYVLAAEPWGDAAGVYQLWTIDARTGEPRRLTLPQSEALLGPSKATRYAMRTPEIARLNGVSPVEPIPIVRDGALYWQVHVVPNSSAGLSYVAFVEAASGSVSTVETGDQARAFLAGEAVEGDGSGSEGEGARDGLVVVVERADGSTERLTVGANDTVVIRPRGGQENATTGGTETGTAS